MTTKAPSRGKWPDLIGGESFLEKNSLLLIVPYIFLVSILSGTNQISIQSVSPLNYQRTVFLLAVANGVSIILCWLFVELLDKTLLNKRRTAPLGVFSVVSISFIIGALKGFTTGYLEWTLGAVETLEQALGSRWFQAGFLAIVFLSLLSLATKRMQDLNEMQVVIVDEFARDQSNKFNYLKPHLAESSRLIEKLQAEIEVLEEQIKNGPIPAPQLQASITNLLDNFVRPVSRKIWKRQLRRRPTLTIPILIRIGIKKSTISPCIFFLVYWIPVFIGHTQIFKVGESFIRATFITTLVSAIVAAFSFWKTRSLVPLFVSLSAGFLISSWGGVSLGDITFGYSVQVQNLISIIIFSILAMQTYVCTAYATGLNSESKAIRDEFFEFAKRTDSEREMRIALSRQHHREFAQFLHSEVQNNLLSALFMAKDPRNREESGTLAIAALRVVLERLRERPLQASLLTIGDLATELDESWGGFLKINWNLEDSRIADNYLVDRSVLEALSEAISNSLRHGLATDIDIKINYLSDDPNLLTVIVSDNGIGPRRGRPGLGSELLSSLSPVGWKLEAMANGGAVLDFGFRVQRIDKEPGLDKRPRQESNLRPRD